MPATKPTGGRRALHELDADALLTPAQVARSLPGSRPLHPSTVVRWAREGVRNTRTGEVVTLRSLRAGRRVLFRPVDVIAFLERAGQAGEGSR